MERRIRPRLTPLKETLAFLNGSSFPARVLDYSAAGMGVHHVGSNLKTGNQVAVDIVVNEELCVCCMPGTIQWIASDSIGIRLDHADDRQADACRQVETKLMY